MIIDMDLKENRGITGKIRGASGQIRGTLFSPGFIGLLDLF